ncbi:thioredoxin family protein [Pseudomonas putida]|uniref:thioredoxin family protein n=2 Tax=Pseudomonas TaxID=286 RepID=UPI003CC7E75E
MKTTLGGALRRLTPTRRRVGIAMVLTGVLAVLGGRLFADSRQLDSLGPMPPLSGAVQWLNSPPLDREALKGKVVLVDFWTYDCINCRRSLPHVNSWAKRYADQGLVVVGVHTPEYDYENDIDNVREQVARLGIEYPVAIDNRYAIWNAFANQFWPAHYFVDASGQVRYVHFGEGAYAEQEQVIQQLLAERGHAPRPDATE